MTSLAIGSENVEEDVSLTQPRKVVFNVGGQQFRACVNRYACFFT